MYFLDKQNEMIEYWHNAISSLENLDEPQLDFLEQNISEHEESLVTKMMSASRRYFHNKADIGEKKRTYIDREGIQREDTKLSNTKLYHPMFRKIINQKVNYLLSKKPTITFENDLFEEQILKYFNDNNFYNTITNLGKECIIDGISWLQIYYDEKSNINFKIIPAKEIIPFWKDTLHTDLEALIRVYNIISYDGKGSRTKIQKVEYYTNEGVWYYERVGGKLVTDVTKENSTHFSLLNDDDNEKKGANWEKIPFVSFRYNSDELGLLFSIKSLIDDYDKNTSDTSDILQDNPNKIKVVKGYEGTDKGLFSHNLATYRTIFVANDGSVNTLDNNVDVSAVDSHLNRLRKDIFDAANAVDIQNVDLGNASGISIKFKYTDLDNDVEEMANEFKKSLDILMWFLKVDILIKTRQDFSKEEFEIVFNKSMIVNETDIIANCANSIGIISNKTILANHPWVNDIGQEEKQLDEERNKDVAKYDVGFGNNEKLKLNEVDQPDEE